MKTVPYRRISIWLAIVILPLLVLMLSGCGGKSQVSRIDENRPPKAEKPISPRGYNHFMNANLLELFGAYQEALKEYQSALRYIPESVTIRTDYARLLFRLQQIPDALEQALKIEPKDSETNLLIGDCYRLEENPELAMLYYGRAVEQNPDNINAYWYMAGYYEQTGKQDSAIAVFYELARLSDTYRIWQELGRMLGQEERFSEALDAFKKSVELNPEKNNINAFLGLATTYDALDSMAEADETYDRAIALDPYDVRIYRHMLAMNIARDNLEKSIEAAEKLVELVPSDWVAQRRLGVLLYSDNQLERADSLFESRISFGDDSPLNYFYRGRIAFEQDRLGDAIELLKKTIEADSTFTDAWISLAFVHRQMEDMPAAVDVLRRGVASAGSAEDSTRLLFPLGSTLERQGEFYDAVTIFQEIIRLNTDHAPALNYLGYMLADRGEQLTYALELIEKAISLEPDNGAFIDSYGWVQYKLGNFEAALAQLKRAADIVDDDPIIFEHIGDVYRAMGNREEALKYYNRALELEPESLDLQEKFEE